MAVLRSERVRFGERVELGEGGDADVWATIAWRPSALGALRALLYKPPQATLAIEAVDGANARYRLPRLAAQTGFLLDPWIDGDAAFLRHVRGEAGRRVKAFRVDLAPEDARFVEPTFALTLSRGPERAIAPGAPDPGGSWPREARGVSAD
jgi:hypothetical protein